MVYFDYLRKTPSIVGHWTYLTAEELADFRRQHTVWTTRRWERPEPTTNESEIRAGINALLNDDEFGTLVRQLGKIGYMQAEKSLPVSDCASVFVLKSGMAAGTCCNFPMSGKHSKKL